MKFFYNIFITLLISAMKIGAIFNYKLKKGLAGRRQSCDIVKSKFSTDDRVIWMHAASLGEYEQGLPVLEKLQEKLPNHKILFTIISEASGCESMKFRAFSLIVFKSASSLRRLNK
jgi:3-deoxy-D-manno-octulosonic-acid transferase